MANVQIRNVPDDLHARLKERAAKAGQSLNQFMLAQLDYIAQLPTHSEMAEQLRSHKEHYKGSAAEIAAIIREDRDSR